MQAFIGGIDLCLGRWDTKSHPLSDLKDYKLYPGLDYNNPFKRDFENIFDFTSDILDRNT